MILYSISSVKNKQTNKKENKCSLRFRLKGPDFGINSEEIDEDEREIRVVLTAPHKGQFLSDPSFYHLNN